MKEQWVPMVVTSYRLKGQKLIQVNVPKSRGYDFLTKKNFQSEKKTSLVKIGDLDPLVHHFFVPVSLREMVRCTRVMAACAGDYPCSGEIAQQCEVWARARAEFPREGDGAGGDVLGKLLPGFVGQAIFMAIWSPTTPEIGDLLYNHSCVY